LLDIHFIEISARRFEPEERAEATADTDELATEDEAPPDAEGEEVDPSYGLRIAIRPEESRFLLRVRIELTPSVGPVVAEVVSVYGVEGLPMEEIDEALLVEYTNQVGVMALLPYLRQAIADVTQRVFGAPLLMPVLMRGAVTFSRDGDSSEG
jgi:preprotein translocase subunit SecB